MTITGIISAIIVGFIIGMLGRLVVPGKQRVGLWLTIIVGIVAALIGSAIARYAGYAHATSVTSRSIDWLEILTQVGLAAVGVALISKRRSDRR